MNIPVKFELAKLLKEKGFDELCNFYFDKKGEMHLTYGKNSFFPFRVYVPTAAEAVMWLYEKHGVWITVDTVGDEKIYPRWIYKLVDLKNPNSNIEWELNVLNTSYEDLIKNSFISPTLAYEVAIEYTLNNLI